VATGPFEVESWDRDDQVTLKSRYADGGQHYLPELTPKTNRVQFKEAVDPQVRATLLQTGEVDAALLEPKDAAAFVRGGYGQTGTSGSVQLGVFFSGNLWEKVSARDGSPLDRLTYNTNFPWIGNPDDAADMEQARLVRRALSVAYDRDQINESLLAGLGKPVMVEYFSTDNANWQSKWNYPYDPDEAIDILSNQVDGNYYKGSADSSKSNLNGHAFEVSLYAGPELGGGQSITGEVVDAVAGYWAQLGLATFSLKYSYQTFRPSVVGRTNTNPFVTSCDKGRESNPWYFPKGLVETSLTRGGFSCGLESPDILNFYYRMAQAPDQATATQAASEYLDYVYHWNLQPGIVAVPDDVYFNTNKIASWPMPKSASSNIDGVWNLTLK
jgi:ABC-type transport system substrate-binding protein